MSSSRILDQKGFDPDSNDHKFMHSRICCCVFRENKACIYFMRIVCLADNSYEIVCYTYAWCFKSYALAFKYLGLKQWGVGGRDMYKSLI